MTPMPVPQTALERKVRRLVTAAMESCHHDAEWETAFSEPGARHEAEQMTREFTQILSPDGFLTKSFND